MIGLVKGTARQAKTVSGLPLPIASYKSNSKLPIQELSLSINPTQEGSGDPAPDNIRPITGVSEDTVYQSDVSPKAYNTNNTVAENVYAQISEVTDNSFRFTKIASGQYPASRQLLGYLSLTTNHKYRMYAYIKINELTTRYFLFGIRNPSLSFKTGESLNVTNYFGPDVNEGWVSFEFTYTNSNDRIAVCNVCNAGALSDKVDVTISKMTLFDITDNADMTFNPYTIALGDTYYGGELDVDENGNVKLRADRVYDLIKNHNWILGTYTFYAQDFTNKAAYNAEMICDIYKTVPAPGTSQDMPDCSIKGVNATSSQYRREVYLKDTRYSTVEALVEAVGDYGICYKLYTPIEIDLGNLSIPSLLGQNHIWHDGNGDVEVLKFMDRQLYFGR